MLVQQLRHHNNLLLGVHLRVLVNCQAPLSTTHPLPLSFKHEGGVLNKNPKSKTDFEWSPLPNQHKSFQGGQREGVYMELNINDNSSSLNKSHKKRHIQ